MRRRRLLLLASLCLHPLTRYWPRSSYCRRRRGWNNPSRGFSLWSGALGCGQARACVGRRYHPCLRADPAVILWSGLGHESRPIAPSPWLVAIALVVRGTYVPLVRNVVVPRVVFAVITSWPRAKSGGTVAVPWYWAVVVPITGIARHLWSCSHSVPGVTARVVAPVRRLYWRTEASRLLFDPLPLRLPTCLAITDERHRAAQRTHTFI